MLPSLISEAQRMQLWIDPQPYRELIALGESSRWIITNAIAGNADPLLRHLLLRPMLLLLMDQAVTS